MRESCVVGFVAGLCGVFILLLNTLAAVHLHAREDFRATSSVSYDFLCVFFCLHIRIEVITNGTARVCVDKL